MKLKIMSVAVLLLCLIWAAPAAVSAAGGDEVFLITADSNGNSYFRALMESGEFGAPEQIANTGYIPYGNVIGDFNNDGMYDYVVTSGIFGGSIYLLEKLAEGNNFASPAEIGSWANAYFPGKMAVGDFDEDGNLDLVMTYYYSSNCDLYLGDGNFGFATPVQLPSTAPSDSIAADSADFNNDGHVDFITVSSDYSAQFYVNLGDGSGNFETRTFGTHDGSWYLGMAAADFNGDGAVDLAATTEDAIDIYWGDPDADWQDGLVHIAFGHRIDDSNIYDAPLDSYDFNKDGKIDLVIGAYGQAAGSGDVIAVFYGNGDGTFTLARTYDGGDNLVRVAVATPPPAATNQEPVAVIEPAEMNVTAGDTGQFYATGSYDPDGEIATYQWDFGDGQVVEDITPVHVFYEAGDYSVSLTVTDTLGASNTATAVVHVAPVPATVVFHPRILNLKSRGRWILAKVRLADGYDTCSIDAGSLAIVDPQTGQTVATAVKAKCRRRHNMLMVKFKRRAVSDYIGEPNPQAVLHISGKVAHNGGLADFAGSGSVRAIKPGKKYKHAHKKIKKLKKRLAKKNRKLRRHKRH